MTLRSEVRNDIKFRFKPSKSLRGMASHSRGLMGPEGCLSLVPPEARGSRECRVLAATHGGPPPRVSRANPQPASPASARLAGRAFDLAVAQIKPVQREKVNERDEPADGHDQDSGHDDA